jgi:hypothetical protein
LIAGPERVIVRLAKRPGIGKGTSHVAAVQPSSRRQD